MRGCVVTNREAIIHEREAPSLTYAARDQDAASCKITPVKSATIPDSAALLGLDVGTTGVMAIHIVPSITCVID